MSHHGMYSVGTFRTVAALSVNLNVTVDCLDFPNRWYMLIIGGLSVLVRNSVKLPQNPVSAKAHKFHNA